MIKIKNTDELFELEPMKYWSLPSGLTDIERQEKLNLALSTGDYVYSLKTDGIFGDKTKYVYEQYKKDNYNELSDDFKEKQKLDDENKKYEDMALKGSDGKPLLIASNDRDLSKLFFGNISSIQALPSNLYTLKSVNSSLPTTLSTPTLI